MSALSRYLLIVGALRASVALGRSSYTEAPIIGVLTTPIESGECVTRRLSEVQQPEGSRSSGSCFHTLYVQWLEGAGARVVPILYDTAPDELEELLGQLNGVLFTGGETFVSDLSSPYMVTAFRILNHTLAANRAGDHVPIWGSCMGFQTLTLLVAQDPSVLQLNAFDSESLPLPLTLPSPGSSSRSRMLTSLPPEMLRWVLTENITVNMHHDGVQPEAFQANKRLQEFYQLVSINVDRQGKRFASTIEGKSAPVYAVQWHPERPQFQFSESAEEYNIPHNLHAIRTMQAFSNFFVSEARRNGRHFKTPQDETAHLIYNYAATGPSGDSYQAYHFPPSGAGADTIELLM